MRKCESGKQWRRGRREGWDQKKAHALEIRRTWACTGSKNTQGHREDAGKPVQQGELVLQLGCFQGAAGQSRLVLQPESTSCSLGPDTTVVWRNPRSHPWILPYETEPRSRSGPIQQSSGQETMLRMLFLAFGEQILHKRGLRNHQAKEERGDAYLRNRNNLIERCDV